MPESARTYPPATHDGSPDAPLTATGPAHQPTQALDGSVAAAVAGALTAFFDQQRAAAGEEGADGADGDFTAEVVRRLEDFVLTGGKRVRPAFAWWGWRAAEGVPGGAPAQAALGAAASLELLHACALIQDDVMDGSALRRGRPAVHTVLEAEHRARDWSGPARRYGESVAVLAGDLALVWA